MANLSPLVSLDPAGIVLFANESFYQEFPKIKVADPVGTYFPHLFSFSESNLREWESVFRSTVQSRLPAQNREFYAFGKTYGYSLKPTEQEIILILRDISDRKKLERKVESLHARLLTLQERERQKISQELHDGVGQTILAAKIHFESNQRERGLQLIDRASQELRELYSRLYPSHLRELGILPAVRDLIQNSFPESITVNLKADWTSPPGSETQLLAYRILQEAIANIIKHAKAKSVNLLLLDQGETLVLEIEDDGIGFHPEEVQIVSTGFGLWNMKRRVEEAKGNWSLHSVPGKGTQIHIILPKERKE